MSVYIIYVAWFYKYLTFVLLKVCTEEVLTRSSLIHDAHR